MELVEKDENGWYKVRLMGDRLSSHGWVPYNYVELVEDEVAVVPPVPCVVPSQSPCVVPSQSLMAPMSQVNQSTHVYPSKSFVSKPTAASTLRNLPVAESPPAPSSQNMSVSQLSRSFASAQVSTASMAAAMQPPKTTGPPILAPKPSALSSPKKPPALGAKPSAGQPSLSSSVSFTGYHASYARPNASFSKPQNASLAQSKTKLPPPPSQLTFNTTPIVKNHVSQSYFTKTPSPSTMTFPPVAVPFRLPLGPAPALKSTSGGNNVLRPNGFTKAPSLANVPKPPSHVPSYSSAPPPLPSMSKPPAGLPPRPPTGPPPTNLSGSTTRDAYRRF